MKIVVIYIIKSDQKAAKRKEKEKLLETFSFKVEFEVLNDDYQQKFELMLELAHNYARIEGEKVKIQRKGVNAYI